ncbi:hypothetical protein DDZ14_15290 [Maritimibacter sp. 55A14]|uniref:HalD/BesD family halogenase n=1 Tax=Maritimibacter sp. 55A14 TaxID=2174844 RepID=UPI000D614DF3|nr:hypothetical protein [Maritimibacter sp. 55A14]PWE30520.1 hypothetical protein DDZ14_15290 [Maritimibacter sp. 55A14]
MNARIWIDLGRYPIDLPESAAYRTMLRDLRAELEEEGCAVLPGFLTPEGVRAAVRETASVAHLAHRSMSRCNAYFTEDDESLPPEHPVRRFFDRSNAFIPADNFAPDGVLRQVQNHPGFDRFLREALDVPKALFHRYADPLGDVIVNTAEAGNGFPWHFDTNPFTVTLALQTAETGGAFEYVPDIRSDGENFEAVAEVLDGQSDAVRTLDLQPGDLQLFRGRHSLHRVTPLDGLRPRHVAIYSYVEAPGMVGNPVRVRQLYGRVLPVHLERAGPRADALMD